MSSYKRVALLVAAVVTCAFIPVDPDLHADGTVEAAAGTAAEIRGFLDGQGSPGFLEDERDERSWKALQAFYRNRGYEPAWIRDGQLTPGGHALLRAAFNAGREGLPADRYDPRPIVGQGPLVVQASAGEPPPDRLARMDVALTYAFLRYAADLAAGAVDSRGSSILWRTAPREEVDVAALLGEAVERDTPDEVLARLRPAHPQYLELSEALARYRRIASAGGWPALPPGTTMRPGKASKHAGTLRARLQASGDLAGVGVGNVHDKALVEALKRFERRHGLRPDGVVDAETLAALNVPVEDRIARIELNLERWRWQGWAPAGRAILVNVPTFELHAYEDGRPAVSMRVVTGKGDSPTPVFAGTMTHVVFSPHWNVPPNIMETEVLPAIRRDGGYLARNNMEFVRGESGALQVRQRPGPRNALGLVKFLFPNPFHVYLHDTPADALFARPRRAFSHGCVRVEKPEELARFVLRGTEWDGSAIARAMRAGQERFVPVEQEIGVTIAYFTAWVDPDGTVRFAPDIYRHDVAQEKLLPAPRPATSLAAARS